MRHPFANKDPSSHSYGFSIVMKMTVNSFLKDATTRIMLCGLHVMLLIGHGYEHMLDTQQLSPVPAIPTS